MIRLVCALLSFVAMGVGAMAGAFEVPKVMIPGTAKTPVERLEFDVHFLADDLLEGRRAGRRGHDFAAQFVAERFRLLDLEPLSQEREYLQLVPMKVFRQRVEGGAKLWIAGDLFAQGTDIAGYTFRDDVRLAHAPIVFVGYGLVSDRYGRDDYRGLDVNGAIVVALHGAPDFLPSDERAHFTRQQAKTAADRGAAVLISILPPSYEQEVEPFERLSHHLQTMPPMVWVDDQLEPSIHEPRLLGRAFMGQSGATKLFAKAGRSWAVIAAAARQTRGFVPGFDTGIVGSMRFSSSAMDVASPNVVGILPGTDPNLRREIVVVTAHLDHRGIWPGGAGGEVIYKGAIDNATGIAAMLETARELADNPPARTVVFAATTAQEHGLVGSDYLAAHPQVLGGRVVANVNLDMPLTTFPFVDMVVHGANHTSLEPVVTEVLYESGVGITDDHLPHHGMFTYSDHYSFLKRGIPSVYLAIGGGGEGAAAYANYLRAHHRRPTDEPTLVRYDQLARFAALNVEIVRRVADLPQAPGWKRGDYFAQVFGGEIELSPSFAAATAAPLAVQNAAPEPVRSGTQAAPVRRVGPQP